MIRLIGYYNETGYIIVEEESRKEIYKAIGIDKPAHLTATKEWCELTGREMARAMECDFLGVKYAEILQ